MVDVTAIVAVYEMLLPSALVPYVLLGVTVKFAYDVYGVVFDVVKSTVNPKK